MENLIDIIKNYYYSILKTNLYILNLFSKDHKQEILSYFNNNTKFEIYEKKLQNILYTTIDKYDNKILLKKINLLLSKNIFIYVNKNILTPPIEIVSPETPIPKRLLKKFLFMTLYHCIMQTFVYYNEDIRYYSKQFKNSHNLNFHLNFFKFAKSLEEDIIYFFYQIYLPFFVNFVNKYDYNTNYIFPIVITKKKDMLVSCVANSSCSLNKNHDENFANSEKCSLSSSMLENKNTLVKEPLKDISNKEINQETMTKNYTWDKELGGNKDIEKYKLDTYVKNKYSKEEIEEVKESTKNGFEQIINKNNSETLPTMIKEPYIKNKYTKEEVEKIEKNLDVNKINTLIKSKGIKLSKNFQTALNDLNTFIDKKKVETFADEYELEEKVNTRNDIYEKFSKIFVLDEEKKDELPKLFNSYMNINDKKQYMNYLIDKISYYQYLESSKDYRKIEILSLVDNMFSKILNTDYNNNSLNLESDDIKFILMLETLESFKQLTSNNNYTNNESKRPNIILNVYKQNLNKAKINDTEIKLD